MGKLKMKTKKSALKRFRMTRNGKILRNHSGKSHFNAKKRGNRKRVLKKKDLVSHADMKRVKRMLGV